MKDIFISYSANDMKMADLVRKHLQNYPTWAMKDGRTGDNYIEKIKEKLENCSSAILILSSNFFQSEFIMNEELPALLERNKDPEFKLLPILVDICETKDIEKLGTINIFPSRSKPMNRFTNEEWNFYMKQFKEQNLQESNLYSGGLKNVTWEELKTQFNQGVTISNPMRGDRELILVAGPNKKLELFIPVNNEDVNINLKIKALTTRNEKTKEGDYFVIGLENETLLEFFYTFCCYLDDEFTSSKEDLATVIKNVAKRWKELTKEERSIRDAEKGLLGELWFLDKLIDSFGQQMIKYWRGYDGDRHDFRIQNEEFEVKTTSSDTRQHYISSINQLEPSLDCNLSLISIQIAPTKSGNKTFSVNKMLNKIEKKLTLNEYILMFHERLQEYVNDDLEFVKKLKTNYVFSSEPKFMEVDKNFPKISNEDFTKLKHHERISDIKYRLNVEGLGESCDGEHFNEIIKRIKLQ